MKLNAEVLGWSELGVAVRMPSLALTSPTPVQLTIGRADGQTAQPITLTAVLPDSNANPNTTEEVPFPQGPATQPAPAAPAAPQAPVNFPTNGGLPSGGVAQAADPAVSLSEAMSLAQAFSNLAPAGSK